MYLSILISFIILLLDQLCKFFIEKNLYGSSIDIIENVFSLTYVQNTGGAFGILSEKSVLLMIFVPILIIAIIYYLFNMCNSRYELIAGSLIVGGALGNYIDRIFRGYVVDFLDFKFWPVFNISDIAIVVGCILMVITLFFKEENYNGKDRFC